MPMQFGRFRGSNLSNMKITGMINSSPILNHVFVAIKYKGSCGVDLNGCSAILNINAGGGAHSLEWAISLSLDSKIAVMRFEQDPA